jgi:predicted ATP-binding protein involved in virulence
MYTLNPQFAEKALCMTPGVILIDEIDLHLHPEWQHQILDNLRGIFPKVQFIVTTQAPAIISSARSDNLVKLNDYQVGTVDEEIHGNDINSLLRQIMDVSDRNPELSSLFDQFHGLLGARNYDAAEAVLDDIAKKRSYHDQEIARCRVKLRLERIKERNALRN